MVQLPVVALVCDIPLLATSCMMRLRTLSLNSVQVKTPGTSCTLENACHTAGNSSVDIFSASAAENSVNTSMRCERARISLRKSRIACTVTTAEIRPIAKANRVWNQRTTRKKLENILLSTFRLLQRSAELQKMIEVVSTVMLVRKGPKIPVPLIRFAARFKRLDLIRPPQLNFCPKKIRMPRKLNMIHDVVGASAQTPVFNPDSELGRLSYQF